MKKIVLLLTLFCSLVAKAEISQLDFIRECYDIEDDDNHWMCMAVAVDNQNFCKLMKKKESKEICNMMFSKKSS